MQPHPRGPVYPPVQVFLLGPWMVNHWHTKTRCDVAVNYVFSHFLFLSKQSSLFSYSVHFGSFLGGVGWSSWLSREDFHMAVLKVWYSAVYSVRCTYFSSFQGDIAKPFKTNTSSKKQLFQRRDSYNKVHSIKE